MLEVDVTYFTHLSRVVKYKQISNNGKQSVHEGDIRFQSPQLESL